MVPENPKIGIFTVVQKKDISITRTSVIVYQIIILIMSNKYIFSGRNID
jgi:hypothetical protein